ncbi:glycoside hydrolase family 31 protein [Myxococcota bacterium]|nr:glycoside hydrolase family 31 protein [Myxococcota bacterium]
MDTITKIKALWTLGLRNNLRALVYERNRRRIEARCKKNVSNTICVTKTQNCTRFEAKSQGFEADLGEIKLEVKFLEADLIQVTYTPGALPLPYGVEPRSWPEVEITPQAHGVCSSAVEVTLEATGGLHWSTIEDEVLRIDAPPQRDGEIWHHQSEIADDEVIYGLGEKAAPLNRRGRRYHLWNREPMGTYAPGDDPLYLNVPVLIRYASSGRACLSFYDNPSEGWVDLHDKTAEITLTLGSLRYYVAFGSLSHVIDLYTHLTGRPALPPRWALGYHQCRWSYKSAHEVRELVAEFERRCLPLSAVHLDIHYMDGYRVFTVDSQRFSDLKGLSSELEAKGIKLVAILDPGIKVDQKFALYREGEAAGVFLKTPEGQTLQAPVWPGWVAFPDFTDPQARLLWAAQYQKIVDWGIAGVWHDMNEPAAFSPKEATLPRCIPHVLEGRGGVHQEAHNIYALMQAKAGAEGLRHAAPFARPWILSRAGWAGLQRYAWTWTGDCESSWRMLRETIRIGLGLSLSGIPYTGPDIGGFSGQPSAELYIRWFQLGAALPFFRTHSAAFVPARTPWSFGEKALKAIESAWKLRYKCLPYWYTLAYEANQTGAPLIRPLSWIDPKLKEIDDSFLIGNAMLIAPVLEEKSQNRVVTLPSGDWYYLLDLKVYSGTVKIEAPLDHLPVFIRAGHILPVEEDGIVYAEVWPDLLGNAKGWIYQDDGDGYGTYRIIHWSTEGKEIKFRHDGDWSGEEPPLRWIIEPNKIKNDKNTALED